MRTRTVLDRIEDFLLLALVLVSLVGTAGLWRSLPDLYFVPQHGVYLPERLGPGLADAPPILTIEGTGSGPLVLLPTSRSFDRFWTLIVGRLAEASARASTPSRLPAQYVAFLAPPGLVLPGLAPSTPPATVVMPIGRGQSGFLLMGLREIAFRVAPLPMPRLAGALPGVLVTDTPGAVLPERAIPLPILRTHLLSAHAMVSESFNDPLVVREVPSGHAAAAYSDGVALLQVFSGGMFRFSRPHPVAGRETVGSAWLAASTFASEHPLLPGGGLVTGVSSSGSTVTVKAAPLYGGLPVLGASTQYVVAGDTVLTVTGRAMAFSPDGQSSAPAGAAALLHLPAGTAASLRAGYPAYLAAGSRAVPVLVLLLADGRAYAVTAAGDVSVLSREVW